MTAPRTLTVAAVVAAAVFTLYRLTLLPDVDFGDSGSIQTTVGSPLLTPRDGYPLYFAIGSAILHLSAATPAHAMNLASAIGGGVACGLFVIVATELAGSLMAAVGGALLLAVSYTFWSQSVTAEVYALHITLVLVSLFCILRWELQPTRARLAIFFSFYAFGFGNHLSMILLAPGFTMFLLLSEPRGWRSLFAPRVIALALGIAALGATQYLWNVRTMWFLPQPPGSVWEAVRRFWFDVTKSDWRDTMVLNVPRSMLRDHTAMYWFDLRQQFGVPGLLLAGLGAITLTATRGRRAALLLLLYGVNLAFAFTYDVGDAHVFYLPSHLVVALLAGVGAAAVAKLAQTGRHRALLLAGGSVALIAYAVARGYLDYPALDRSRDDRPTQVLKALTANLDDHHAILLADLNWQVANGLSYFTTAVAPEVAVARMDDVILYAPALIHANRAAGRDVVATDQAERLLRDAYGPLFESRADSPPPARLGNVARKVTAGTRYVVCALKPTGDYAIDREDLTDALRVLSADTGFALPKSDYVVVAGVAGEPATIVEGSDLPFRRQTELRGTRVQIRMDAWLAADTIRRMGFGHVIVGGTVRQHTLIAERGVSFVSFDQVGQPLRVEYLANLFASPQRYLIDER